MISVILPAYERLDAVKCCLAALGEQTLGKDRWELVVVDDSLSTVIEREWDEYDLPCVSIKGMYLRSSPPRTGSFTAGRARNIGAANASGDLLVFVDQDIMLAPDALEHYETAYGENGDNVVIIGLFHWMRRVDFNPSHVRTAFNYIVDAGLGNDNTLYKHLPMDVPGLLGTDQRQSDFSTNVCTTVEDAALGCWSANIGYPRKLFMELGGFDENIRGHGGEDADLGLTAKEYGARFLQYSPIWGVHRWHGRDQEKNAREVQENIAYIDRKHGIGAYANADKVMDSRDWTSPEHYHKDVGGTLIQIGYTVYVCRDGHALGLPTPDWLEKLGFDKVGLQSPPSGLDNYTIEGVAK